MPAWSRRKFLSAASGLAIALLAGVAGADPAKVREEGIQLRRLELIARDDAHLLLGGYDIQLNPKLEEALMRGVAITFVQEFGLLRPRDYWFDEEIVDTDRTLRLSYNALLRSFALAAGPASRNFDSLAEALAAAGSMSDWVAVDRRLVRKKTEYRARARMFVDISQLPKPLQVNAFASDRWHMDSGTTEWTYRP